MESARAVRIIVGAVLGFRYLGLSIKSEVEGNARRILGRSVPGLGMRSIFLRSGGGLEFDSAKKYFGDAWLALRGVESE